MVYRVIRCLVSLFLHIRFRVKVEGVHHIPAGVVFGPPVTFNGDAEYEEIAAQVMEAIRKLKERQP